MHRRPRGLAADKGYDNRAFRQYLSMRGIRHSIPERKKAKRRRGWPPAFHGNLSSNRWKVERFFAWLDNFRRLATRFERLCIMHLGFIQMGCVMSLLRNVLK
ncbi:transposase [Bilophila wadsworthia]|uniref:transposase n=1 Tax=Bilophila wadsworthia TaxID=35833 RepID=UPI00349EF94F